MGKVSLRSWRRPQHRPSTQPGLSPHVDWITRCKNARHLGHMSGAALTGETRGSPLWPLGSPDGAPQGCPEAPRQPGLGTWMALAPQDGVRAAPPMRHQLSPAERPGHGRGLGLRSLRGQGPRPRPRPRPRADPNQSPNPKTPSKPPPDLPPLTGPHLRTLRRSRRCWSFGPGDVPGVSLNPSPPSLPRWTLFLGLNTPGTWVTEAGQDYSAWGLEQRHAVSQARESLHEVGPEGPTQPGPGSRLALGPGDSA